MKESTQEVEGDRLKICCCRAKRVSSNLTSPIDTVAKWLKALDSRSSTKERGYDIEERVIHECMHLKHDGHTNEFACEMKKHIGRHVWQYATKKPIGSLFVGDEKVADIISIRI